MLQDDERQETAFEAVSEYIARNPERRDLVAAGGYAQYKFTGCLIPGYPELKPFETTMETLLPRISTLKNCLTRS